MLGGTAAKTHQTEQSTVKLLQKGFNNHFLTHARFSQNMLRAVRYTVNISRSLGSCFVSLLSHQSTQAIDKKNPLHHLRSQEESQTSPRSSQTWFRHDNTHEKR